LVEYLSFNALTGVAVDVAPATCKDLPLLVDLSLDGDFLAVGFDAFLFPDCISDIDGVFEPMNNLPGYENIGD
jgi:hypothetical protein